MVGAKRGRKGGRGRKRGDELDHGCLRACLIMLCMGALASRCNDGWCPPESKSTPRIWMASSSSYTVYWCWVESSMVLWGHTPPPFLHFVYNLDQKTTGMPFTAPFQVSSVEEERGYHLLFLNSQLGGPRKKKKFEFQKTWESSSRPWNRGCSFNYLSFAGKEKSSYLGFALFCAEKKHHPSRKDQTLIYKVAVAKTYRPTTEVRCPFLGRRIRSAKCKKEGEKQEQTLFDWSN